MILCRRGLVRIYAAEENSISIRLLIYLSDGLVSNGELCSAHLIGPFFREDAAAVMGSIANHPLHRSLWGPISLLRFADGWPRYILRLPYSVVDQVGA